MAGDTDSIMFLLPHEVGGPPQPAASVAGDEWSRYRMPYVWRMGEHIGDVISARLPPELIFELEGKFTFAMWITTHFRHTCTK